MPPNSSFFQSLCVLGYCIFPIDIAALVSVFVGLLWVRLPVCAVTLAWSVWGESRVGRCCCASFPRPPGRTNLVSSARADFRLFLSRNSGGQLFRRDQPREGPRGARRLPALPPVLPPRLDDYAVMSSSSWMSRDLAAGGGGVDALYATRTRFNGRPSGSFWVSRIRTAGSR